MALYYFCGYIVPMAAISIRDLANNTSGVVSDVQESGRPAIVTKHGRPVAAVVPINQASLEDFVLANAPEYVEGRREAEADLAAGRTRALDEVLADIGET